MSSAKKMLLSAAGVGGAGLDVSEVFSTHLYKGTGSAQTVTNNLDLSGEGGMIWIKSRSNSANNVIVDTEQGAYASLAPNSSVKKRGAATVTAFSSSGFTVTNDTSDSVFQNTTGVSGQSYTSWTFRKAEKFFDVVRYTGTGSAKTVAHNLGSVPGMIIVKKINADGVNWAVYHRANGSDPQTDYLILNTTAATADSAAWWNDTAPTDSVFTVGTDASVNQQSHTYVAYLFAHNDGDGEFGSGGDSDIINCGTFTTDGSGVASVTLGWQPQWIIMKKTSDTENWVVADVMRGIVTDGYDAILEPNTSSAEGSSFDWINLSATGFNIKQFNTNSKYIFTAIRAPMITEPSAATEVFALDTSASSAAQAASPPVQYYAGFPVDMTLAGFGAKYTHARLTNGRLRTDSTAVETVVNDHFDSNQGYRPISLSANTSYLNYLFKRAKGFFDVVGYTGNDSYDQVPHSLGVAPEMVWYKERAADTGNYGWGVVHTFATSDNFGKFIADEFGSSYSNVSNFTTTHFPEILDFAAGGTYIAYLFASLAGISKIGLIAHSGSSTDVNCGFSNGSRFVMLKRMDAAGAWYVWDSVRGIVSGDDPYHLLNTNAALVTDTDFIDPLASGFQISGDFTDGTYLFYAIA